MPLEGFFSGNNQGTLAPYLQGYIDFPRLGITSGIVFLIDTGSYSTALHPGDVDRLGIDYRRLNPASRTYPAGIGGRSGYYAEPAVVMFPDRDGTPRFCELEVHICEPTDHPAIREFPALLGRDFLNRCSLFLDSSQNLVQLEPKNIFEAFIQPAAPG